MKNNKIGVYHFKNDKWGLSEFQLIEKYKEHGFDAVCFYANYQTVEHVSECICYARKIGLNVDTVHGPLKNNPNIWNKEDDGYVQLLKDYIQMCGNLNIKYFVMHTSGKECISFTEVGLNNFKELVSLAKKLKVTILLENLRTVDHLIFLTDNIKSKNLQVCLDFGHANVWCYLPHYFIKKYKSHIKAVHIHDNFGPEGGDKHLIPFKGNIDWAREIPYLYKYYHGPITLELDNFKTEEYKYDDLDKYLDDAYNAAEKLYKLSKQKHID